jgi:hypothetical protein
MVTQKLPSAAAATLTISNASISLRDAIRAADSPTTDNFEFLDGMNAVTLVVESENIHYRIDGNDADTTNGVQAYEADEINLEPIELDKIRMIRSGGSDATVKVVQIAKKKKGEI